MKTSFGEFKITSLRETAVPYAADTPERVAQYVRENVFTSPTWSGDVENMVVLLMNTRMRIIGHTVVATGTLDQVLCGPREIFRPAIIGAAKSVVLVHNHPSGDPTPSEADINVTRQLRSAGKVLQIEVTDHIIMGAENGNPSRGYTSLRELGHIY